MVRDSLGRTPRHRLSYGEPGNEETCARSGRYRKHDRRCRKLLLGFLPVRRRNTRVVKRRHIRKFVTVLFAVFLFSLRGCLQLRHGASGDTPRVSSSMKPCSWRWKRRLAESPSMSHNALRAALALCIPQRPAASAFFKRSCCLSFTVRGSSSLSGRFLRLLAEL